LPAMIAEIRPVFVDSPRRGEEFERRLGLEFERIFRLMHDLYGWRWDFSWRLIELVRAAALASLERPKWLRRRDASDLTWMTDSRSLWAMTYTDRFAGTVDGLLDRVPHHKRLGVTHLHLMPPYDVPSGPNDGGYAVSSYRRLRPDLGDIDDLRTVARSLDLDIPAEAELGRRLGAKP